MPASTPALAALLALTLPAATPQARLESALAAAVTASCPGARVRFDPDLNRAARAYAEAVRDGRAEAGGDALAFFDSLESIDPNPFCGVATIDRPAQAERAVADLFPRSCRFELLGVAAETVAPGQAVVAVLTASRAAALAPLPGRVEALDQVRLEGRLTDPRLVRPRLYHLRPGGEVDEHALPLAGGRFSLPVRLAETGEHALEVLADGPGGPQVVALRRIFAGVDPPRSPPPRLPPAAGDGLEAVERAIAQLRRARNLPPLQRDAALDAVAAGHSAEMARLKSFAHVLPTDGALGERLTRAGYAWRSAGENIGLAEEAVKAHEAVEQSPAHLWNLLDPRHRRLGLGAVRAPSPDGPEAVWLTEVLALPVVGSSDPAGEALAVVSAERKKRGLPPLARSSALDELAVVEVRKIARSNARGLDGGTARRALEAVPGLRSAAADLVVAGAAEEVAASKNLALPDWRQVGVGTIYASSEQYGPGRLWVLLIYGR